QPAQGGGARGRLRRARSADRPPAGGGGPGPGTAGPGRQRDHGTARYRAGPGGRPGVAVPQGAAPGTRPARPRRSRRRAVPVGRAARHRTPAVGGAGRTVGEVRRFGRYAGWTGFATVARRTTTRRWWRSGYAAVPG